MSTSRPVWLPREHFADSVLPTITVSGACCLRIHGASWPAAQFRLNPDHRFSHPNAPAGLLYLADDFETCVWECFGDEVLAEGSFIDRPFWNDRRLVRISLVEPLEICDLTDLSTRRALGVDLSALSNSDLDVPQAWGLAIQNHPQRPDGLRYFSRFTDRPCLALFERPGLAAKLAAEAVAGLPDLDEALAFLETHRIALV